MENVFSISSVDAPTNKDVTVTFSPPENVNKYVYTIYNGNSIYKTVSVNNNKPVNIYLNETGKYKIKVVSYQNDKIFEIYSSGNYLIDKDSPELDVGEASIELHKGDVLLVDEGIYAVDNFDGDITNKITNNFSSLNLDEEGHHSLVYSVSDSAGNTTTKTVDINVLESESGLIAIQMVIIAVLLSFAFLILKFKRAMNNLKRISDFSIEPIKDDTPSLFETLVCYYLKIINFISSLWKKSVFLDKYAKKLDKYAIVSTIHKDGKDILSGKIFMALAFFFIAIFSKTIQLKLLNVYEFSFPLIVGFMVLDIIYFIKYKVYRKKIENDFLSAIIVMNNAFKSGRSITQAIEIVSEEVEGEIGKEFKKMSIELSYGLSIDVVFKRFSERIKLEEVSYLTASLSILNKTGGNIVKVFTSIEKNLFNKKKLRLELDSLTGSSKLVVYLLLLVPFLFIIFVSMISPTYFLSFINTKIGNILLILMIIYYIIFIIIVRKIMKVVI